MRKSNRFLIAVITVAFLLTGCGGNAAEGVQIALSDDEIMVDGKEISTGEKRIYAPNVVSVVNGVAKELETGITDELVDPFMEITDQMKKEIYNKFSCSIKCVLDNKSSEIANNIFN